MTRLIYQLSFCVLVLTAFLLLTPQMAFCQTEKLGSVSFTPLKGWTKTARENTVAFSKLDEATGKFCIITLYGATPGTGSAPSDFKREWNNLAVKPLGAEANPKTETQAADGWTAIAAGSVVDSQGSKAAAFLTVFSGFGKTVSVLGVFNDESYLTTLVAFSSSLDIEKEAIAVSPTPKPQEPLPPVAAAAAMHVAALVKEFENNEIRANQTWIGKRVRVYGTVNTIEIGKDGNIILTFKSSIATYNTGRCFFNKSQSSRVATLNAHEIATVEGTVRGLGGGFDNSKAFLILENCTIP